MPPDALSSLMRAATIDDHDEVLKAANAAIKAERGNFDAQHTRVVALLKLDRFHDAVRAISEGGVKLEAKCPLEKAYALYKLGKLDEAMTALQSSGLQSRSFSHIAAQVAYRAERFSEAEAIYKRLLDASGPSQEDNDIHINLTAALAQSEWQGFSVPAGKQLGGLPDTFELSYNAACVHIARSSLDAAANLLQRAAKLCDASDDLTHDDKKAELQAIIAQQAYVHARLGNAQQALDLYKSLHVTGHDDPDLVVVVQNNKSALETKPPNPYLLQRLVATCMAGATKAKLFQYQSNVLSRNESVINLLVKKSQGVRERTRKVLAKENCPTVRHDVNIASVVNVAAETQGVPDKELFRELVALSKKRPNDVAIVIIVIQFLLRRKNSQTALSALESFLSHLDCPDKVQDQDVRFSPGLVALTVSLMRSQGRDASARSELARSVLYWRDRPVATVPSLLQEAGVELLKSSNPDNLLLAASAFQKLNAEGKASVIVSTGLVAALATHDASKVEMSANDLPSVGALVGGIDADALVAAGVVAAPNTVVPSKKRPAPEATSGEKMASKRRRRLPKTLAEGQAPDPERWLPLRDRSTYRPKTKKGKKKAAESTQGGIIKDGATLGPVGGGSVKVEKAPSSNPSKKKKKKGRK